MIVLGLHQRVQAGGRWSPCPFKELQLKTHATVPQAQSTPAPTPQGLTMEPGVASNSLHPAPGS